MDCDGYQDNGCTSHGPLLRFLGREVDFPKIGWPIYPHTPLRWRSFASLVKSTQKWKQMLMHIAASPYCSTVSLLWRICEDTLGHFKVGLILSQLLIPSKTLHMDILQPPRNWLLTAIRGALVHLRRASYP